MTNSDTGLCECGCGGKTTVAARNHTKYGWVKGQPMRYIRGHAMRGKKLSVESRAKVGDAHRGKPKPPEQRRKMSEAQTGAKGNNWQGGEIIREGRVLVYVGRDHPMADSYGYVYQHRLVMAEHYGKVLTAAEHVHHIDLDPRNNHPSNLVILSRGNHRRVHNLISQGMNPSKAVELVILTK